MQKRNREFKERKTQVEYSNKQRLCMFNSVLDASKSSLIPDWFKSDITQ